MENGNSFIDVRFCDTASVPGQCFAAADRCFGIGNDYIVQQYLAAGNLMPPLILCQIRKSAGQVAVKRILRWQRRNSGCDDSLPGHGWGTVFLFASFSILICLTKKLSS